MKKILSYLDMFCCNSTPLLPIEYVDISYDTSSLQLKHLSSPSTLLKHCKTTIHYTMEAVILK